MKSILVKFSITFTFVIVVLPALAQGAPPATPIDGGLSVLLAAAGLYGLKKIRDSRKS